MLNIAILSNVNIDSIERYFRSAMENEPCSFYKAGYNQYIQELLQPNSVLNTQQFDIICLFLEGTALFEDLYLSPLENMNEDFYALGAKKAEEILSVISNFLEGKETFFVINTIVISPYTHLGAIDVNTPASLSMLQAGFNTTLIQAKTSSPHSNFALLNWQKAVEKTGYEAVYDPRFWYLGRIPFNERGFKLLATKLSESYKVFLRKSKKVILLDLDNTLWGGVLGEDGIAGIALSEDGAGKAYRDFQRMLKDTKNKGVLLAAVSKNNLEDVREVWSAHPMMVLKEDDFVAHKINWSDKAENIRALAEELNLGLDSFVFIDDNPVERERIKQTLPEVEVPEFPEDPAYLVRWFSDLSDTYFNFAEVTSEDKQRSDFYKRERERKTLRDSMASLEDFYKNLAMKAVVTQNPIRDYKRIAQLTQRTNQFNLTTKRYSETEILNMIKSTEYEVFDIALEDKFGKNGIIGVMIVKIEGENAWIDTFLLSCRVVGRTVENTFWKVIATFLKKRGIKKVLGEYIPTRKNMLVEDLYDSLGFHLKNKTGGRKEYEWNLSKSLPSYPSYIQTKFIKGGNNAEGN